MSRRDTAGAGLAEAYDAYFTSQVYDRRYPAPNPSTLDFLRRWVRVGAEGRVLDLGCGNGRYALPLLESGAFSLVGCDISAAALQAFHARLQTHPARGRVLLLRGEAAILPEGPAFDAVLMMFGVLAHIDTRTDRVATLQALRRRTRAGGRLLLSVPSALRRMPLALARAALHAAGPGGTVTRWSDIRYRRRLGDRNAPFTYHLYLPGALRAELAEGGWRLDLLEAESALPESLVCRSARWARLDEALRARLPAALGYGLRALAVAD